MRDWLAATIFVAALAGPAAAQTADERPATITQPTPGWNYERRSVDIPMRDGVTLHTVILIPSGAKDAPILLTRTPYNAEGMTMQQKSGRMDAVLDGYDNATDVIVAGGYIRVVQDVRGKYGSQGIYMMNPALAHTQWNPTDTDDSTDAYDTIDWLVKHLPQSNGKVGVLGISYDGFTALMPLINPHPALAVAVPMNPMVDGWRGDDWFHNGAFRQGLDYVWEQIATRDNSSPWTDNHYDSYDDAMEGGSAGAIARAHGLDQIGFWRKIAAHPAYDSFWSEQAMDTVLAKQPLKVPVMLVHSLWDQEDIYGATAVYKAIEPKDTANDRVFLTLGPWYHGQEIDQGSNLGAIKWDQDTAKWWRWHVLAPFLSHWLKGTPMDVAPVTVFQSGANEWQRRSDWPGAPATAKLYLKPDMAVGFEPAGGKAETADYVSDPAHPVTFVPRPVRPVSYEDDHWKAWLTSDQRNASSRPDVLSFTSDALTAPVTISGQPMVHLNAATSGSDSDWVVKLIDVYPDQVPLDHAMGGYQLAVGMDIFRGRYRESLAEAKPIAANKPLDYVFALPNANHVFLPGHRIMVQVQSSWFPLYDRNPQKFVPNIFFAKPGDYQKAMQKVTVAGPGESYIALPLVK
ncbi:CocE/NonD family hydrolase [Sphingomonas sp. JC676]|uniref:CocE/NonD family hydrolase n=1 Tax=Sphingomonas sp. JC676 TaxID=2768065 RepID=UPI001657EAFC|nr:CocE/NonD family hydrolase [Sphingomonas sp. JC676]MBC9034783.1 CocE/NonD family hydrolase [Sphingomonas sp. JC676]